jgi:hypothetical protein
MIQRILDWLTEPVQDMQIAYFNRGRVLDNYFEQEYPVDFGWPPDSEMIKLDEFSANNTAVKFDEIINGVANSPFVSDEEFARTAHHRKEDYQI